VPRTEQCIFVNSLRTWRGPERSNVTLYMIGDSTMFHQAVGACQTFDMFFESMHDLHASSQSQKKMSVRFMTGFIPDKLYTCKIPLPMQGSLTVAYYSIAKPISEAYWGSLAKMQELVGQPPDILYFNAALHYLHMLPASPSWDFKDWQNYETDMDDFLSLEIVRKTALVVFMKSHAVCDTKYNAEFGKIVEGLERASDEVVQPCLDSGYGASSQQCMDGFMVKRGVSKLNTRAANVINAWVAKNPQRTIGVVDGFSITENDNCEHTEVGDAKHYPFLVFRELRALWEIFVTPNPSVDLVGEADYSPIDGC